MLLSGIAAAALPGVVFSGNSGRNWARVYLAAVAIVLIGAGLVILARGNSVGAVPLIAGIGALAGWLPFCWSASTLSFSGNGESADSPNLISLGLPLIGTTGALVAAARLIPAAFAENPTMSEPVLFLAASLSLLVATARLISWRSVEGGFLALTAMAACGIAADVALRRGTSTLPVAVVRGDVAGLAVWLHGSAILVFLRTVTRPSSTDGRRPPGWLVPLLVADLAGLPPLPGFWLRGNLLLSLVSRQTQSSITGEFEPHTGMLTLAILVAIAWGAMMAAALPSLFRAEAIERAT